MSLQVPSLRPHWAACGQHLGPPAGFPRPIQLRLNAENKARRSAESANLFRCLFCVAVATTDVRTQCAGNSKTSRRDFTVKWVHLLDDGEKLS